MRRLYMTLVAVCLWGCVHPLAVHAQFSKVQGFCENGSPSVVVPGTQGSGNQKVQQSYPGATVNVYDAGTTNASTIYSDSIGTVKANPFACSGSGQWFFYGTPGNRYDVKFSNGGIAVPFTLGDFIPVPVNTASVTGTFTAGRIPYTTGATSLVDSANLTWNNGTQALGIRGVNYVFPNLQGAASTSLTNDGAGNLTWVASSASGPGVVSCSISAGSYSVGITNCLNTLPASGGTLDARANMGGNQNWNTDAFLGNTKPVDFQCGAGNYTVSVSSTIPASVHSILGDGCLFIVNTGITLTIPCGNMAGSSLSTHFAGAGKVLCGGSPAGRGQTSVFPDWFGAVGDGTTDDTAAIQAAINAVRQTSGIRTAGTVTLTKGQYAISSLDLTLTNGLTLQGQAGQPTLYAFKQGSSLPILDMTGCVGCVIRDLGIQAQDTGGNRPTFYPSVGILIAETNAGGNSNFNVIQNVSLDGWYTIADVVCYNCTENTFIQFQTNFKGTFGSSTTGLILTDTNDYGLSSPYQTINPNPNVCANLNFLYYGGGGVKIDGCQQIAFLGGNIAGSGANAVQFENHTSKNVSLKDVQFSTGLGVTTAGLIFVNLGGYTDGLAIINPSFNNSIPSGGAVVGVVSNGGLREANFVGWNAADLPANAIAVNIANISSPSAVTLQDGIIEAANRAVNAGGSISGTTIINASAVTMQATSGWTGGPIFAGNSQFINGAQVVYVNGKGADGKSQIVVGHVGGGSTQPLETFSDSTLIKTETVVSGTPQLIVGAGSTDFSPGNVPFIVINADPVIASASATTNANVLTMRAGISGGNPQIVSTHSAAGTTNPLDIFVDSTVSMRIGNAANGVCVRVGSALRLLTSNGTTFLDGGACPF